MTQQKIIIIKNTASETFTFEEITRLKKSDIIKIRDLPNVANTISEYFIKHSALFSFENNKTHFAYRKTDLTYDFLNLNTRIAFGLTLDDFSGGTIAAKIKRLKDKDYLLNLLRKSAGMFYAVIQFYHDKKARYMTDYSVTEFQNKKIFNQKHLNKKYNKEIDLEENKKNRAKAAYSNAMQIAEFAAFNKHHWLMATITCPAVFHIKPITGKNSWNGQLTPNDNNKFINNIIKKLTTRFHAKKIKRYGHLSKEPHQSMALHAHMLIYCEGEHIESIKQWINNYTEQEFLKYTDDFIKGTSVNFRQGRCESGTQKPVNKAIVEYINKHVYRCINSKAYNPKLAKNTPQENRNEQNNYKKIEAHADKFNYRRYSIFGVDGTLTKWKKLKQLTYNNKIPKAPSRLFNTIFTMVKNNKFKEFLHGSHHKKIKLIYKSNKQNTYNENIRKLVGMNINNVEFIPI